MIRQGSRDFLFCLTVLAFVTATTFSEETALDITPPEAAQQPGEEVEFTCTKSDNSNNETLIWLYHNGTDISHLNMTRFHENDGVLKITNIQESDAGEYTCITTSRSMNSTATLKVYDMPSYFLEGMILMAVNLVLVLIFISCAVWRFVQTRRDKKKKKSARI